MASDLKPFVCLFLPSVSEGISLEFRVAKLSMQRPASSARFDYILRIHLALNCRELAALLTPNSWLDRAGIRTNNFHVGRPVQSLRCCNECETFTKQ